MTESQRNLLILVVIAVIGSTAAAGGAFNSSTGLVTGLLNTAITLLYVVGAVMLYRRNSGTIAQLAVVPRLTLQLAAIAAGAILVTGRFTLFGKLPYPTFGWGPMYPVIFYGALFACAFAIWWAWQQRVSRW